MKNLMKISSLAGNVAKFINLEQISNFVESTEKNKEVMTFNKNLSEAEILLAAQKLSQDVEKEKDTPSPSEIRVIQGEVEKILEKLKELNPDDFGIKKNPSKLATKYAEELADSIKEVSAKIDKFRENDVNFNEDYTYFSLEIGNTLADAEIRIRKALDFCEKAKTALDSHKDLVGVSENEILEVGDANKLRDPIFYNPNLKVNPFIQKRNKKDDISKFDLTKKGYQDLISEISTYKKLTTEIKEMIAKPYNEKLNDEIKKWKTNIDTSKKNIERLKTNIKESYLEQDMIDVVYNSVLKNAKSNTGETKKELEKYEKQREGAAKYINDEYLGESGKGILHESLTGEPYYFSTIKGLDEKLRALKKYVSKNSPDKKYRTDDLKGDFRKRNIFNSIGAMFKSKDKKGFLLEQRKVAQFTTMEEAIQTFNSRSKKSWNETLDESVEAEEKSLATKGKLFSSEEKTNFREKKAESILSDLNLYIQYHNAEVMLKEIEGMLTLSKDLVPESDNNKILQAERFTEKSLDESLKKHTKLDYKSKEKDIEKEEQATQPELFKKNSEDYQKYYMAAYDVKVVEFDLEDMKKDLLSLNEDNKDYDITTDPAYFEEALFLDKLKAREKQHKDAYLKNNKDLEISFKTVKDIYGEFADVASDTKNKVAAEGRTAYYKIEKLEEKVKKQKIVVSRAEKRKENAVVMNSLKTDKSELIETKKRLERADKFLQQQHQKLLTLEKEKRVLANDEKRLSKDGKELGRFREKALRNEK